MTVMAGCTPNSDLEVHLHSGDRMGNIVNEYQVSLGYITRLHLKGASWL